jgi:hypothetical protein
VIVLAVVAPAGAGCIGDLGHRHDHLLRHGELT